MSISGMGNSGVFSRDVPVKSFFYFKLQKSATNSSEVFIISSFTDNSEDQWVVFIFAS